MYTHWILHSSMTKLDIRDNPESHNSSAVPSTIPSKKEWFGGSCKDYGYKRREESSHLAPAEAFLEASSGGDIKAVLQPHRVEMALLSNILAAYFFVSENPERAALYFVSGVCIGLVLTLVALVMRISCRTDCRRRPPKRKFLQDRESNNESSDSEDSSSDNASDLSAWRHRRFQMTLNKNVFTSAEELERAQRLEERERIIREIWMNGQPEVLGTRSLNCYY
ncbi:PREDICTED: protein eva-1 homolog A-like [Chrysochloris asiatica]|uniref:Protein eva-1 homolog A-like n=1 Tax=Chrysochloris asiatica TaxID=185453 RepID=A0A9B0TUX0_CHRAS|nr:PREDICTED: protein eva-1 homolog A-like [Chrysochloris asiatica]